ncbi:MAG: 16S rRNA (cytosine(1402)-N(4))-methyltransferase RsmH [bacterium]|nr:16S rRNA (cytosine(1402)-N(4))-methyltransferase RsmH [Candidatus Kapabacteria bacterium]
MSEYHVPVMLRETLDLLVTDPAGTYVDGTLGGGGHTAAMLERVRGTGRVLAFDADPGAIANAHVRFGESRTTSETQGARDLGALADNSLVVRQAYFSEACEMLREEHAKLDGVLLDLGVSSRQLDSDQIGLSYRATMPLDMRFDPASDNPSAREIVNGRSAEDIATLLRTYGEEPAAWKIAQSIASARAGRSIETTTDLREIIEAIIPQKFLMATLSRVFQALRIAVNDELGELAHALDAYTDLLGPGGRLVILTYHSLEDRIVKDTFREEARSCICPPSFPICRCDKVQRLRVLTRKPMLPSSDEVAHNPRARSAKLRAAEKVDNTEP